MITIYNIASLKVAIHNARTQGLRIGLVPTMGNLHDGHISLIKKAKTESDIVITSIFVNPLQFGHNEDLTSYPRTLEDDKQRLTTAECEILFAPTTTEMFPNGYKSQSTINVPVVSEGLCAGCRPGHFDGVATIVSKLFNIISPDIAVFGEKDYQQLAVIKKMTRDLNMHTQIIEASTIRAPDGLALSSRNNYLSQNERQTAPYLYHSIKHMASSIKKGIKEYQSLINATKRNINSKGFMVEYIEILNQNSLEPATPIDHELIILIAAKLGRTRLIDNIKFII